MARPYVWDRSVRLFHWLPVAGFAADALPTDPEGRRHASIGDSVAAPIGLRRVRGLVVSRLARLADFPPSVAGAMGRLAGIAAGRVRHHPGHGPPGAMMICKLLLTLAAIA